MRRDLSVVIGGYNEAAEQSMLAIDRAFGYTPFVAAIPEAAAMVVPPQAVYEPRVSVPIGALLWGISAFSTQAQGFSVQVTDVSTQKPLFSQPIDYNNFGGGSIAVKDCYGQVRTLANPLHMLPKPMMVLTPGVLAVKIQNFAAVPNKLQVCLHFALPTHAAAIYPNAYNKLLTDELAVAARAIRDVGSNAIASGTGPGATSATPSGNDLIRVAFEANAVGDNIILAGNGAGRISIYELDIWNQAQQDVQYFDGPTPLRGKFYDFPAQSGAGYGYTGQAHFQCSPGQPFIIRLSVGTPVTGYLRYRME